MKNLTLLISIIAVLAVALTSCGPAIKLKRAERLIKKAELQGATWRVDSVQVEVPVFIDRVALDTLFVAKPGDTITITRDRLKVKFVDLPGDTVFVSAEVPADTVYKTVTKTVTNVIQAPDKGLKWWHFILIGFFGAIVLYFIIRK